MAIYKRGKTYWYKFMWRGEAIRDTARALRLLSKMAP